MFLSTTTTSMSIMIALLFLTTIWMQTTTTTMAYPTGAGDCPEGVPAVGGSHVSNSLGVTSGSLNDGSLTVHLNGVLLVPGKPANFTTGKNHLLTLTAISKSSSSENAFTGLLFRLGKGSDSVDTTTALSVPSGDTELQVSDSQCIQRYNVGGVTHSINNDMTNKTIVLRLDEAASNLPLDVTVVGYNADDEGSSWYYSAYILNAVGSSSTNSSSSSSLRGNSTKSNSTTTMTNNNSNNNNSTSNTKPSKVFIITTVLLGIIAVISLSSMVTTMGCCARSKAFAK